MVGCEVSKKASRIIALPDSGEYTVHMQEVFPVLFYHPPMSKISSLLRRSRESAGISVRELARQIGECHTNVSYWERTGKIPRSDVLLPISIALGVTVEELLGEAKPKRASAPGGRMRQLFDAASKLPRSKQEKVLSVLEPFITAHTSSRE